MAMGELEGKEIAKLDAAKLHQEVNQLVGQRFQITAAAVVAFSAVLGWLTSRITTSTIEAANLASVSCILLLAVLLMLYLYFDMLLGMMRIFTVYLKVKGYSQWEADWAKYRRNPGSKKYFGYSKAGRLVFCCLGVLSFLYPRVLVCLSSVSGDGTRVAFLPNALAWVALIMCVHYVIWISVSILRRHENHDERKITRDWTDALRDDSPDA
jgi:hypothetical protein